METSLNALHPVAVLAGTVWLVTSLVSAFTLGVAWMRPSYPGWRSWAAGHAALVLGLLVGFLRTPQTLLPSVVVGNGLVMVGTALVVAAFQRFTGAAPTRKTSVAHGTLIATLLLGLAVLTIFPRGTARFLLASSYLLIMGWTLVRLITRQMTVQPCLKKAYGLNVAVVGVVCVLTLPRLITIGVGGQPEAMFALNLPNVLMYVAVLLLSVGGTLAFWMLHEDRRRQELQAVQTILELLAYQDPLTQVLNRRGLWQAFATRTQRAMLRPLTLVLLDIDEFKALNDQHGHAAGDHCLKTLATVIQDIAGPDDLIGRLGGDEFVLLLTSSLETVSRQLTLLTYALKEGRQGQLGFTVSFGHTVVEAQESLDSALIRADALMYSNKAAHKALARNLGEAGRSFGTEHDHAPIRPRRPLARKLARQER